MAIYKEDIVDIELKAGSISRNFLCRAIGEGDKLADRFGVHLLRNGEEVSLSGVSCTGYFIRSDGGTVTIEGAVSGNIAYVDLPQTCYAYDGQFSLAIKLTGGDVTGTMRIIDGVVANTMTGSPVDPGEIIPSIETLIAAINAAIASIPSDYTSLLLTIAGVYSSSSTYQVGQYVWYNGTLYRCIEAITTAEAWTSSHWTTERITSAVATANIRAMSDNTTVFGWTDGKYINTSGTVVDASVYSLSDYIPIVPNVMTTIATRLTSNAAIAFYDADKRLITTKGTTDLYNVVNYQVYNVPAYFVRISCMTGNRYYASVKQDLNAACSEYDEAATVLEPEEEPWFDGYVSVNGTEVEIHDGASYTNYKVFTVTRGENLRLRVKTATGVRAYILVNSEGTVTDYSNESSETAEVRTWNVTIKNNGVLYVNTFNLDDTFYVCRKAYGSLDKVTEAVEECLTEYKRQAVSWTAGYVTYIGTALDIHTGAAYTDYCQIEVKEGETYKAHVKGNKSVRAFVLTDQNSLVYDHSNETWDSGKNGVYTIRVKQDGYLYVSTFDLSVEFYVEKAEYAKVVPSKGTILILGDSQTQRTGYPERLISDLSGNYNVIHFGHGGANSLDGGYLYGSIPLYVEPFTIPATTTAAELTLFSDVAGVIGDDTAFAVQTMQGVNPCVIDGVPGEISFSSDPDYTNKKYYFTRAEAGSEHAVSRPKQIFTQASEYTGKTLVLWYGTNDGFTYSDPDELYDNLSKALDTFIEKNGTGNYIVMGLTSKTIMSRYAEVNVLLARKYGYHFLDLASYILQYGLTDAGITPTAQDEADIAAGEMPTSLRADGVHFNTDGYNVIGDLLYRRGAELGYWS